MNKHIGKSYDKVDSKGILTGKPSYTGDFVPKDALVIKVLRSPHAQARIKSIDTSKAKLIPGVEAILHMKMCLILVLHWLVKPIQSHLLMMRLS